MYKKDRLLFAGIFLLALIIFSKPQAFIYYKILGNLVRWQDSGTIFSLHPVSFPPGNIWEPNFTNAIDQWNAVVSNLDYKVNKKQCNLNAHHDGTNCVAFIHQGCADYSGKTFPEYNSFGKMKEADIWFDLDCLTPSIFDSETTYYNKGHPYPYSFRYLSLHELGHSLYLGHAFDEVSVMNYYTNFERLMGDDKNAARFLYTGIPQTDLSVSTDKDIPGTSNYLTQVKSTWLSENELSVEYTIQNMGTTDVSNVDVSFYLEDIVTQSQVPLATSYFDLPVHSAGTFSKNLTIPADLPVGIYKIYFEIDKLGMIPESDETNNRLAITTGSFIISVAHPYFTFGFPSNLQNVSPGQNVDFDVNVCNQGSADADGVIGMKIFFPDPNLIYVSGLDSYPYITLNDDIHVGDCLPVHLSAQVSPMATEGGILPTCAQIMSYDDGATEFEQSPICGHFNVVN